MTLEEQEFEDILEILSAHEQAAVEAEETEARLVNETL